MANDKAKFLLITGPPGCGKNTLLRLYCKKHNLSIVHYKEEQDSRFMSESLDLVRDPSSASYPNDLENLNHFLRVSAKTQGSTQAGGIKVSSFNK